MSFDREAALRAATLLFWRHGYEGASVAALVEAMGVTPPSLYAAWGSKRGLFREAVAAYVGGPTAEGATAREVARAMLEGSAGLFTGEGTPRGCLLATAAITGSHGSADVRAEVAAVRRGIEAGLRARIEAGIAAGEMPVGTDAEALAGLVMAVIQGLSTLARDGASRARLMAVADAAMLAWP